MGNLNKDIIILSKKYSTQMIALRRQLHQYPEVALEEFRTQKTIASKLKEIGCSVDTKIWKTAVIGKLTGKHKGKTIAIRSDMDALPVMERTGLPFTSKIEGRMHACGHDVHMSIVWGAAKILSQLKENINGGIKFIYQPSEERHPGGAKFLIANGVLKNPKVAMVLGLHVEPTLQVGKIGIKDGPMMAQSDNFLLVILGRSGHAARPHETVDAIVVAASIVTALQNISSRQVSPLEPVVITIGKINGGVATNVIADRVEIKGTVRTINAQLTRAIPSMIEKIVAGICNAYGARYEFHYERGYPSLANSKKVNDLYRQSIAELFGKKAVYEIPEPVMGAEDFAYYARKVPAAMMRLGVRNEQIGADKPWHHPQFKVDEKAIPIGAAVLANAVMKVLG